jgi:hypothetical protein
MGGCTQPGLTAEGFDRATAKLRSLADINLVGCSALVVAAAKRAGLTVKC